MSKVKFIDLPEGVQIIAADMLKQQMECVANGEWCAEATRIANAFLAMYDSSEEEVTIQGAVTIVDIKNVHQIVDPMEEFATKRAFNVTS